MKIATSLIGLGIIMILSGAANGPVQTPTHSPETQELRQIDNQTFTRGEWLKFRVHYGFITAGYLEMEVKSSRPMRGGRPCYHIVGHGYTHSGFEWFYTVDDKYESYCDEESLVSWQFNRQIREGSFSAYTETHFDQYEQIATHINNKKQETNYIVPEYVQDVISSFYYARARYSEKSLHEGDRIELHNFIDRKPYRLEAKLLKREIIEIDDQEYKAMKFDLLIEEIGMITDGSTVQFWISDDPNKIPLRIESELMVGSLKADLIDHNGLLHSLTSRVED